LTNHPLNTTVAAGTALEFPRAAFVPSRTGGIVSMHVVRRSSLLALAGLVLVATPAVAQNRRTDVKRFQWNPVVVHVAAEAPLGVELYMSLSTRHWALTWFRPDSLDAWLPQLRALMERAPSVDSTPYVSGRGESRMRVRKGIVQGRQAYALQLAAEPAPVRIEAWLSEAFLTDLSKALEKATSVARDLERAPALANALPVHEQWDVDTIPQGAAEQRFSTSGLEYMVRGNVVVGFVVDTAGHVVPSSVTIYDCLDPNLAKQWTREVAAWRFTSGMLDDKHVAVRVREAYALDTGGSFQTNNQRVVPGTP
jgi:hypothetical protein